MKTRLLFRGMTSSDGISAANQERSDWSWGISQLSAEQKTPSFTDVFIILIILRKATVEAKLT